MTDVRHFFDNLADTYTNRFPAQEIRRLVADFGLAGGMKVLEAGSGKGDLSPFLLERISEAGHLHLVDISSAMMAHAKKRLCGEGISFTVADVATVELPPATFDAAVCFNCFPHFTDKPRTVRKFADLLKSNGRLVISHDRSRQAIVEMHCRHQVDPAISGFPDQEAMRALLETNGFRIERFVDDRHYLVLAIKN